MLAVPEYKYCSYFNENLPKKIDSIKEFYLPTEVLTFKTNRKQVREYGMRLTFIHLVAKCQSRIHTPTKDVYVASYTRAQKII